MKGPKDKKMSSEPSDMNDPGDGGAMAVVAGLLLVVLLVIGAFYYFSVTSAQSRHIDIDVHPVQVGVAPARH